VMQQEMASTTGPLAGTTVKCPTRVITYAWGENYVDTLLTLTLPALLAPGNLPYVASEVPCELVIVTERRFFSEFHNHPTIARIRKVCPIRFVRLDDLIVSKDKYGMTLTYALHRAFSDLGPSMTEHWQIFLNADFILASGSLRSVIHHLSRGARIIASPSYCTIAEQVIPELRKRLDATTSILSVPPRELARLVLQNRHLVIQGKTINQTSFHMRYADQFYWSVDDSTLLGYQMPVSIVGLRPERSLTEPNSYWDFGLIWEYCPKSEVCVIGDSDEFLMMELREKNVAEEQVVLGPPNKREIAERMLTWVTPYQRHFLKFPLTLHDRDLPPKIDDARVKLRSFVDEVMSNAPPLPSHVKHSQWEYHWANFQDARRLSSRIRSWAKTRLQHAATVATSITSAIGLALHKTFGAVRVAFHKMLEAVRVTSHKTFEAVLRATFHKTSGETLRVKGKTIALRAKRKAVEMCKPLARVGGDSYVRPALRRFGLEIVKSTTLSAIQKEVNEANWTTKEVIRLEQQQREDQALITRLEQQQREDQASIARLEQQQREDQASNARLQQQQREDQASITRLDQQQREDQASITRLTEKITDLSSIATEYQFKLERSYDYQALMAQDELRAGMSNLEPEFLALYEQCRQYTMTSWERLYALYQSVQYTVENRIPGDLVECGVWRGGSMKLVAHVLRSLGDTTRTLFLYDTFEGMTEPEPAVDIDFSGNQAVKDWHEIQRRGVKWAYAPVEEVHEIIASSGYPMEKVKLVKGRVEETIPATSPASIALLRLDTDWYSSTKHEMEHLYPKLSPQGILILDDYGHYQGARRGVDEYFSKLNKKPLLQRVDYSCRLAVKPSPETI
jgi:Macrocin-O-methyltransferase (TylF)